jgi:branched-chain amino acid transport system permease protein
VRLSSGNLARVVLLALLVAAPLVLDDYRVFLLTEIVIFGLFAASLDLLIGYAGLPSLGHAGYLGVGAYAAGLVALHETRNVFAQIGVATVAAAVVALLTGILAVRARGIYFLMLTLAFGQLLWELALNWTRVTGGSNGLFGIPQPALGTTDRALRGNDRFYWYALAVFLVGYGVLRMIVASPFGRALGAIRENEGRMSSLGYNVPLYKLTAFTIAGAVAGYAGALFLQQPKYFSPEGMSFEVSALAVVALIVGGQRSLLGPVLGAAFVYVIRDQLASVLAEHWRLVLGAVFVLVVYLLPGGFVAAGRAARRRVGARGAA